MTSILRDWAQSLAAYTIVKIYNKNIYRSVSPSNTFPNDNLMESFLQ